MDQVTEKEEMMAKRWALRAISQTNSDEVRAAAKVVLRNTEMFTVRDTGWIGDYIMAGADYYEFYTEKPRQAVMLAEMGETDVMVYSIDNNEVLSVSKQRLAPNGRRYNMTENAFFEVDLPGEEDSDYNDANLGFPMVRADQAETHPETKPIETEIKNDE